MTAVLSHVDKPRQAKVLATLVELADEAGTVTVAGAGLAEMTGLTPVTLWHTMSELQYMGIIVDRQRLHFAAPNTYTLSPKVLNDGNGSE
jgi:biotin operon repressor